LMYNKIRTEEENVERVGPTPKNQWRMPWLEGKYLMRIETRRKENPKYGADDDSITLETTKKFGPRRLAQPYWLITCCK